jgi:UDP-N-acetylglucosamine 2-epimerase (non-hydrolysing)
MSVKVVTIVGTRPEIIKLSRVIAELDRCTEHVLVHTGQNYDYELNEIFFQELDIRKPDHFLEVAGSSVAETIGNVIARADKVLEQEQPDALLLLGDTNSCLSVIAAKRRKIPVFHMEAGNRCFDERVPEEINRRIVDHTSDINLPYTEHARRYLLDEGLPPDRVIKTGSPMREVLSHYLPAIEKSAVHQELGLSKGEYFIVSIHREENIDDEANFGNILQLLGMLAERYDKPIIVSTHPRTRNKLDQQNTEALLGKVRFLKPLGFPDYVKLQMDAYCVISDSGTITEEAAILGFPAVTVRQAHERPEGMDEGVLIMTGLEPEQIIHSIEVVSGQSQNCEYPVKIPDDYQADNVSRKVARIILSYTGFVNRVVWRK